MAPRLSTVMLAAACVAAVLPAQARTPATPVVETLDLECKVVGTQQHTVAVKMKWGQIVGPFLYQLKFTNTQGQATAFYMNVGQTVPGTFPVPTGTYTLTVAIVGSVSSPTPMANSGQSVYPAIVVPAIVSTNGRGTGCAFQ